MSNRTIALQVCGAYIRKTAEHIGASGSGNAVTLRLTFDKEWDGTTKTAYFIDAHGRNPVSKLLTLDQKVLDTEEDTWSVDIPAEALASRGEATMTVKGVELEGETVVRTITTAAAKFKVLDSEVPDSAGNEQPISADQATQLQGEIDGLTELFTVSAASALSSAGDAAESAEAASASESAADLSKQWASYYKAYAKAYAEGGEVPLRTPDSTGPQMISTIALGAKQYMQLAQLSASAVSTKATEASSAADRAEAAQGGAQAAAEEAGSDMGWAEYYESLAQAYAIGGFEPAPPDGGVGTMDYIDGALSYATRAEAAQSAAEAAVTHGPYIGAGGTWMIWDADTGAYADSGVIADGRYALGDNLELREDGKLWVKTTDVAQQDNTLPITSAGVDTIVGNIAVLLAAI